MSLSVMTCSMAFVIDLLVNLLDHSLFSNVSFSSPNICIFLVTERQKKPVKLNMFLLRCVLSGDTPLLVAFKTKNPCVPLLVILLPENKHDGT